jgi:hypothetical protein
MARNKTGWIANAVAQSAPAKPSGQLLIEHQGRNGVNNKIASGTSLTEVQGVTFTDEAEVAKAVRLFREGGVAAVLQEG